MNACEYQPISLLRVIIKIFCWTQEQEVEQPVRDNQYKFRSAISIDDILTVITYRISEAVDNTFITRAITSNILKSFNIGGCYIHSSCVISGKVSQLSTS